MEKHGWLRESFCHVLPDTKLPVILVSCAHFLRLVLNNGQAKSKDDT